MTNRSIFNKSCWNQHLLLVAFTVICSLVGSGHASAQSSPSSQSQAELNDSHFHLTNYIQEGTDLHDFLTIMGTRVGRVALFGIPL